MEALSSYKAAFSCVESFKATNGLKICPECKVLTCVSHGSSACEVHSYVCISTLQQGRHVNWSQRLPKGGALVNRLLPPATPKLSTVWQLVATNRSRIYRSAMWIQVH